MPVVNVGNAQTNGGGNSPNSSQGRDPPVLRPILPGERPSEPSIHPPLLGPFGPVKVNVKDDAIS